MKRLAIIMFCIFLVSCSQKSDEENYFASSRKLYVTFESHGKSLTGTLETEKDQIVFLPDSPKGLRICLTPHGGSVSYDGIEFAGSVAEMTELKSLYDALHDEGAELKFSKDRSGLPQVTGKDFKLTVHKELDHEK